MSKIAALVWVFAALSTTGCARIEDGETGVKLNFGKISDQPMRTGWHLINPITTQVEIWEVKTQELKEMANVPSSEGLISALDISVLYNIPAENAPLVRKMIGRDYREKVLEPYVRESIRNVVSGYMVKALFSEAGRAEIGQKMLAFLREKLEPRGIIIQDVLLRDVKLPQAFAASIEVKLRTEQEALQKEFELAKAKKDAEIEIARAQGVAKSNEIIAGSITESYLRYRWIESLRDGNTQVIYVPTEANLPIMEAERWSEAAGRKK
ncbi:MAG: prohibitin family protein [Candidatus Omnitrophica bacterium]|nr:prohibitin family protein [Candidatus Omnitrophota bacterium]